MTKAEFIAQVAESVGLTKKDTEAVVEAMFATMGKAVREAKRFAYPGFGTFTVKERAARQGRNPQTGETLAVKASRTVSFKPALVLKDSLSGG